MLDYQYIMNFKGTVFNKVIQNTQCVFFGLSEPFFYPTIQNVYILWFVSKKPFGLGH
jgi:hypothetical protein